MTSQECGLSIMGSLHHIFKSALLKLILMFLNMIILNKIFLGF